MSAIDYCLSLLAPHECLGCHAEGSLLCRACAELLPASPPECYFCRNPSPLYQTCRNCFSRAGLHQVVVATLYAGAAKHLIWKFKFGGAQAAVAEIAATLPPLNAENVLIVPVPTAAARVRRRGYDQARLLARAIAREEKLRMRNCLTRLGRTHQVGATREERLRQLKQAFIVTRPENIRGKSILLIDDVITTGATVEAAARALYAAGAAQVSALAFARSEF